MAYRSLVLTASVLAQVALTAQAAFAQGNVPELDPGTAVSGVSILAGVVLLYLEYRRRR
jgi:hypothetical protein